MAEAALRSCTEAAGTPRKRSRDPDGSCSEFRTPVTKRLRAPPGSPSQNSCQHSRNSQGREFLPPHLQCSPSCLEENRENDEVAFPGKSPHSRRLELPDGNPGIPANSPPGSASSRNSQLPVGAFYGKTTYLDPLERRRLRELLGDGNVPEKAGNSGRNPRNSGRNPSRNRSSKGKANAKGRQELPKGKNSGNVGNSQNSEGGKSQAKNSRASEGGSCQAKNSRYSQGKAEFRVLSAGVRPPLRLPLGSAFFQSGKRARKIPGISAGKNPGNARAAAEEPSGKAVGKAGIPEEKENQECHAGGGGNEAGIARKSGNSEGKEEESPGILDSQDSLSPKKESGSPCPAGLFPIFLPAKRRPLEELPGPCGIGPSGKAPRKSKESSQNSWDQMIIDAGQRALGPRPCSSCGMLFAPGIPEDRLQHLRHHRRLRDGLRYRGWKQERVVAEFWDGKIVLILPEDPKYALRKAQEVLSIVDAELGFPAGAPREHSWFSQENSRVSEGHSRFSAGPLRLYLFISPARSVLGCLAAQSIQQAFRVLPEPGSPPPSPDPADSCRDSRRDSRGCSAAFPPCSWRCSRVPEAAVCGISRLWVLGARRRRGIARRMADSLRHTFVFGAVLNSQDLAFSDPTADGRAFAARYCGRADFLVYSFPPGAAGMGMGMGAPGSAGSAGSGSAGSA